MKKYSISKVSVVKPMPSGVEGVKITAALGINARLTKMITQSFVSKGIKKQNTVH